MTNPRKLSKLTKVRWALRDNPNIVIAGESETNYLPRRNGYWSHTVDILVAPKDGLYTVEELQRLMMSLLPDIEPTCMDEFRDWGEEINFGKLYFDEVIGTETTHREIVIDDDVVSAPGAVEGKLVTDATEEVKRRTWVSLYPNVQFAAAAVEGRGLFRVSKKDLEKNRGVYDRLKGLLS